MRRTTMQTVDPIREAENRDIQRIVDGGLSFDAQYEQIRFMPGQHRDSNVDALIERVQKTTKLENVRGKASSFDIGTFDITGRGLRAVPILLHEGHPVGAFNGLAFQQFSQRLGSQGGAYFRHLVNNDMADLAAENMARWLEKNPDITFLFRYRNEGYRLPTIRAALSGRYSIVDHDMILNIVKRNLDWEQFAIQAFSANPDAMYLRVIDTRRVFNVGKEDDPHTVGMVIRNGQTGQNFLEIEFMIYRFVCSNGLVVGVDRGSVYRRKHIGIPTDQFAIRIREIVNGFSEYARVAKTSLELAKQIRLETAENAKHTPTKLLAKVLQTADVSAGVRDELTAKFEAEVKLAQESGRQHKATQTVFDLIGWITENVQKYNADIQHSLEQAAGRVLMEAVA